MVTNKIKIPAKAVAERDYKAEMVPMAEGQDKQHPLIMPEKGDIVEFRCKGIVVSAEGDNVIIEVRHVNDSRVEDEETTPEQDEAELMDKAEKADRGESEKDETDKD